MALVPRAGSWARSETADRPALAAESGASQQLRRDGWIRLYRTAEKRDAGFADAEFAPVLEQIRVLMSQLDGSRNEIVRALDAGYRPRIHPSAS
mgnify:CR=1 FL=1